MPVEIMATTKAITSNGTKFRFISQLAQVQHERPLVTISLLPYSRALRPLGFEIPLDFGLQPAGNRPGSVKKTLIDRRNQPFPLVRFEKAGILFQLGIRSRLEREKVLHQLGVSHNGTVARFHPAERPV